MKTTKTPLILGIEIHKAVVKAVVKAIAERDNEWRLAIARASQEGPRGGPKHGVAYGYLKLTWDGFRSRAGGYEIRRNRVPRGAYTVHCKMMWVGQFNSLKAAKDGASEHYERYGYES